MRDFTYKLEGNETQCVSRMYLDSKLVATATSNAKLNITTVTYNRGPGLKAEHDIIKSGSFLDISFRRKMRACLNSEEKQ